MEMDNYEFTTDKDFPTPDDIKKEGDVHRFLADIECVTMDDDGTKHWEIKALDGVKMPDADEEENDSEDAMEGYDESDDETDDSAPKDAKGVAALILKPPAQ
jgi:hypothetical protein